MSSLDPKFLDADLIQLSVARHYETRHGHASVMVGNFPDYDIKFADGVTMELKVDGTAERTGLACIEFESRHKPSGIVATASRVWLHIVPQGTRLVCFELDTKRLLQLCIESLGRVDSGGDGGRNTFKLIPLTKIKAIATQVFELDYGIYQRRESTN